MITTVTVDILHLARLLQEAKSYSEPDGKGGWRVYRLVPDAEARDFIAKVGTVSPTTEVRRV